MYLRTSELGHLTGPPTTNPGGKPYEPPIKDGGRFIREDELGKVLTILSGPSRYHNYINSVLDAAGSKLPSKFLRIVSSAGEVPAHLRNRFVKVGDKVVGGTIDRANGIIYLLPPPGRRSDTRL
ncbi:MAG TPA: hypothetical protein VFU37_08305, partial [Pyrinomonadaceae bacterium]|nr:hypothetical protein [Pyrinomonadaceae bacterium]